MESNSEEIFGHVNTDFHRYLCRLFDRIDNRTHNKINSQYIYSLISLSSSLPISVEHKQVALFISLFEWLRMDKSYRRHHTTTAAKHTSWIFPKWNVILVLAALGYTKPYRITTQNIWIFSAAIEWESPPLYCQWIVD